MEVLMIETIAVIPRIPAPTEAEIEEMLLEEARFVESDAQKDIAIKLLASGYTIRAAARRLSLRTSTIMLWAHGAEAEKALESGREYRKRVIGQRLESAAEVAVDALIDVAADDDVNPRDRVKASEAILDRCGLVQVERTGAVAAVSVDIDFDERLARIVAAGRG
jgi:hypothetical protein